MTGSTVRDDRHRRGGRAAERGASPGPHRGGRAGPGGGEASRDEGPARIRDPGPARPAETPGDEGAGGDRRDRAV